MRLPANVLVDSGSFAALVLALTILISPAIQSISPHSKAINSLGRRPVHKENCSCGHVSPLAAANIASCSSRVKGVNVIFLLELFTILVGPPRERIALHDFILNCVVKRRAKAALNIHQGFVDYLLGRHLFSDDLFRQLIKFCRLALSSKQDASAICRRGFWF